MPIRMSGLISNMDTDSLVKSLVDAQKLKNKPTSDKKVKLEWKQERWQELNKKLYALYTDELSKLRLQGSYSTKKAVSSNSSAVNIKAGTNAPEGSHQIEVEQLASSQYVTGAVVADSNMKGDTLLTSKGFAEGSVINIEHGDKKIELAVSDKTTVNDFLDACKRAGISASYDQKQKRFFLSSDKSGEDNSFSITTGQLKPEVTNARDAVENLINMNVHDNVLAANDALSDIKNKKNVDKAEATLVNLAKDNVNSYATNKATDVYRKKADKEVRNDTELMNKIRESCADITEDDKREQAIEKKIAEAVESKLKSDEYQKNIKDAVNNGMTASDVASILETSDMSLAASFAFDDKVTREANAETTMKAAVSNYKTVVESGSDQVPTTGTSPLSNLGLGEITGGNKDLTATETGSFTMIAAKNSKVIYNGAELTDVSNTIEVNGLTLELTGVTDKPVTCNITRDTEEAYNTIKNFVKKYNEILKEMNDLYYADSAKGYDPLSDEEKEAMSDSQIEKWENKIKGSILRRDSTLGSLTTAMKSALQTTVEVNGKHYSLSSFGVGTSSEYTEKGLLHINGDPDDASVSSKENKLQKALNEDPDLVMQVFTGVAKELYSTMQDKMKKTSLSSALTFYNDKDIKNQIETVNKKIKKQESALTDLENKYYKQFTAMEKAMAKLQSQQNSLAGLLGNY